MINRAHYNAACCHCHAHIAPGKAIIVVKALTRGETLISPGILSCSKCRPPHEGEGVHFEGSGERVIRSTKGLA